MFSFYHILWLILCALLITISVVMLKKYRPSLKQVLTIACVVSVCSELIKTISMIQIVPSSDGTMFFPYLELQHLPLHLCSIQILMIFYCRFAKESSTKEAILAFMYPTCIAGAFLALMMPSIFNATIEVTQCFTHPIAYQYFLFHSMLIILGLWIPPFRRYGNSSQALPVQFRDPFRHGVPLPLPQLDFCRTHLCKWRTYQRRLYTKPLFHL